MKKFLLSLSTTVILASSLYAQDPNFDKKFRFGLRVTPQPTWFATDDKNNVPNGAKFGFGFGLNMEFRFSETAGLLTGIGGDFEGAKYKFRNDPGSNYEAMYLMNENNELVEPNGNTDGINNKLYKSNTAYVLKDRSVKTTFITIPLILKLSTKEYNGIKYSGMFGGEIGIRLKAKAEDTYYRTGKFVAYNTDTVYRFQSVAGIDSQSDINIGQESSGVPFRFCFNAGLGAEYRLAGTTSAFININYFRSLSNQMKKESDYTFYKTEPSSGKSTFIKQNLKMSGIRISVGVMF